jgi:hypothetical protein
MMAVLSEEEEEEKEKKRRRTRRSPLAPSRTNHKAPFDENPLTRSDYHAPCSFPQTPKARPCLGGVWTLASSP